MLESAVLDYCWPLSCDEEEGYMTCLPAWRSLLVVLRSLPIEHPTWYDLLVLKTSLLTHSFWFMIQILFYTGPLPFVV